MLQGRWWLKCPIEVKNGLQISKNGLNTFKTDRGNYSFQSLNLSINKIFQKYSVVLKILLTDGWEMSFFLGAHAVSCILQHYLCTFQTKKYAKFLSKSGLFKKKMKIFEFYI